MILANDFTLKINKEILVRILAVLTFSLLLILLFLYDIKINPFTNYILIKLLVKPLN